jgi:tetratricopeptide (TPR) repeat protein
MLTSTDGSAWSSISSGTPDRLESIDFDGSRFVSLGENGTIITSTNGVNWIKQNLDNRNLWWGSVPPNTAYYMMRVGIGLNKVGRKADAIAKFEEGIKQYHQGFQRRSNDGEGLYYAFEILEPATEFYLDTNQDNKAVEIWEEYIRLAEPFVERNPDDTTSLGLLAYAIERKGDALSKYQKGRNAFDQTDLAKLRAALASYDESIRRRERMLQLDPMNQSHLEAKKTLELKIAHLNERFR